MEPAPAYTAVLGPAGNLPPVQVMEMLTGAHGTTCYNSSHCNFPSRCTLEASYRRYCADTRFVKTPGRTLYDRTGQQLPGLYTCDLCSSPVSLLDFGLAGELGTYQCQSGCPMPNNSSNPDPVSESYQTSNCLVSCEFAAGSLHGAAKLDTSAHFEGTEPAGRLLALREAAVAAHAHARAAREEERAAYQRTRERAEGLNATAAHGLFLQGQVARALGELEVARYIEAQAKEFIQRAHPHQTREAYGALHEAEGHVADAEAAYEAELTAEAAHAASLPHRWEHESEAPSAEASALTIAARRAEVEAEAASARAAVGGLRTLPLEPSLWQSWGRDNEWGGASTANAKGGLLRLTDASIGVRGVGAAGWMMLHPGRAMHAFRLEMDLLIAGGDGGDGFAVSYAYPDLDAMDAAVDEAAGREGAARAVEAMERYGGRPNNDHMEAEARAELDRMQRRFGGNASISSNSSLANRSSISNESSSSRQVFTDEVDPLAGVTDPATAAAIAAASDPMTSHFVTIQRRRRTVPAASASGGLGARVERGYGKEHTPGAGLSLSLTTRPVHAADVWLNGTRLAHEVFIGCPPPTTTAFGGSCTPCATCPGCPPCKPCVSQQECPLRPGRKFVRFVVQMRLGTNGRPPTIEAHHNGLALFRRPVPLPDFVAQKHWALILSAGTSAGYDDDHWVDNLRLALPPTKPPPPNLLQATTRTVELQWFPPHHGGDPISLYRLQRRTPRGWVTSYIGNGTHKIVGPLAPAKTHLFRIQAYNSVGWGPPSDAGSFATASPPLEFDLKPPHDTRVAGGIVRCGGRLYTAGGQHATAPAGVGGLVGGRPRKYLTSLEQYDTATRSWLRRASMRIPRSHPGLACVRERTLIAVGGYGSIGVPPFNGEGPLISSEEYDLDTDRWFTRADAPSARYHASAASEPGGHVFIAGGYGSEFGHSAAAYGTEGILATLERWDPYSGQWTRKAPMPYAAYGIGLAVFDCDRRCKLIAAGGYGIGGVFVRDSAVYDPLLDAWRVAAQLPARRFGVTLLAWPSGPTANAVGGYELSINPQPSATARGDGTARTASASGNDGGVTEAEAQAAMAAARAATMAIHGNTLKSVFEYHIDADAWWVVPSHRIWQLVDAFDWRYRPIVDAAIQREAEYVMTRLLPQSRINTFWNLTETDGPATAMNRYVGVAEYSRPEPARCRHGRGYLGCYRGIGMQRDEYGTEVPILERAKPDRRYYDDVWFPPLRLQPNQCTDCTLLLDPAFYPNIRAQLPPDEAAAVVPREDAPPELPDEPDIFKETMIRINQTRQAELLAEALRLQAEEADAQEAEGGGERSGDSGGMA